jgi:hypothetical protein
MQTYTLLAQFITFSPSFKHSAGFAPLSCLQRTKSLLTVAHSRPINFALVHKSIEGTDDISFVKNFVFSSHTVDFGFFSQLKISAFGDFGKTFRRLMPIKKINIFFS